MRAQSEEAANSLNEITAVEDVSFVILIRGVDEKQSASLCDAILTDA